MNSILLFYAQEQFKCFVMLENHFKTISVL